MEEIEIWKPIEDYEGIYEVSNFSNVKSLGNGKTRKEKILKQGKVGEKRKQYFGVNLWKDGKRKSVRVHILSATAFIPNPLNLPQVNHLDNNPLNNHVSNLKWVTNRENAIHGHTFFKRSSKFTGVCFDKRDGKYEARIMINGKSHYLGRFCCEIEAAESYQQAFKLITNNLNTIGLL